MHQEDAGLQTEIGGSLRRVERLALHLGDRFETGARIDQIDLADQRLGDAVVIVEPQSRSDWPGGTWPGRRGCRPRGGGCRRRKWRSRPRPASRSISSPISSCCEKNLRARSRSSVVERTVGQAGERDAATPGVAGLLGDDIGVAQQLIALAAGVVERQEAVEADGGVDDLPVETLGAGGGMGEPGQDDRVLGMLFGVLGDGVVELPEILVREASRAPPDGGPRSGRPASSGGARRLRARTGA